jgi:glycosidase
MGKYQQLQTTNRGGKGYDDDIFSFVRWSDAENLLVVVNFSDSKSSYFNLKIPVEIIREWGLKDGSYIIKDQLYEKSTLKLTVTKGEGSVPITVAPSESYIYKFQ